MCSLQVHRRILSNYSDSQSLEALRKYNVLKYYKSAACINTAQKDIFAV